MVLAALGLVSILAAKADANKALAAFDTVRTDLPLANTAPGRLVIAHDLKVAEMQSNAANSALFSTGICRWIRWTPVVGTQINGASQLFVDSSHVARLVLRLVDDLSTLSQTSSTPASSIISTTTFSRVANDLARVQNSLTKVIRPTTGLLSSLRHDRATFNQEVRKAKRALRQAQYGLKVAQSLLGVLHPSTVLVLPENNSEMRDQGAILAYSLLRISKGSVQELRTGSVTDINLVSPLNVPMSPGSKRFFAVDEPSQIYQSVNLTADFSWTGATAAAIFQKATGIHVDDVVALDVPAMSALVGATGAVTVPGIATPLTQANFATVLLHDLYAQFPTGNQAVRKTELNEVAAVLFQRLKAGRRNFLPILRAFAAQIPGRHLLLWSANAAVERSITQLGASGQIDTVLPRATFHVAVESAVAAKLDYYVHVQEFYDVTLLSAGGAIINTAVTVRNDAPAGQAPSYQLGPDNINSHTPGEYVANINLWSPKGSQVIGGFPDAGLVLNSYSTDVQAQHSSTTYFTTYIPRVVHRGYFVIRLVPQSRLYPEGVSVSVGGSGWRVMHGQTRLFQLEKTTILKFRVRQNHR